MASFFWLSMMMHACLLSLIYIDFKEQITIVKRFSTTLPVTSPTGLVTLRDNTIDINVAHITNHNYQASTNENQNKKNKIN